MQLFFRSGRCASKIVLAHNLSYDLASVYGLNPHEDMSYRFGRGGLLWAEMTDSTGKKVKFWDTFNHYKRSVDEMGKLLGYPKIKHEFTYRYSEKLLKYCKRDTEIVWRFADMIQKKYNDVGAKFCATIASTAYDLFTRQYCKKTYYRPNYEYLKFFKRAYYGGRTECFRIGYVEGPLHYSDVNSMYPAAMLEPLPLPNDLLQDSSGNGQFEYEGVSHVYVEAPNMFAPILPHRDGKTRKLIFPVGRWRGTYTHAELRYAMKKGYQVLDVYRSVYAKENDSVLKDYSKAMYKARLSSDTDFNRTVFKLLMNSLYGKFATSSQKIEYLTEAQALRRRFKPGETAAKVGPFVMVMGRSDDFANYANVIWAAYITSIARVTLHGYFPPSICYCDTDSVISKKRFKATKKLGVLAHDGTYSGGEFLLPKFYRLFKNGEEDYVRAKGFPAAVASDAFKNGKATFKRPTKFREALRRNIPVNDWRTFEREVRTRYDKRIVLPDGRTEPLELKL